METNNFCVYKHTSPSGKCYIGITSKDPEIRWGNNGFRYIEIKNNGRFKHPKFANSILKYGWENFKHEIILNNVSKSEAIYAEQYLIKWYKMHKLSYNITDGGEGMWGYKFSKETIERIAKAHVGKKQSRETILKRISKTIGKIRTEEQRALYSKKVNQYDLNGNLIATYFGIREASRQTGINSSHIGDCCNKIKNRKSAGGYIWSFANNLPVIFYKEHHSRKKIGQYDLNNNLIKEWNSMKEIIEYYNISRYKLQQYCKSNKPDKNNFIWKEF